MITVRGQFVFGIEREGTQHRDFELRAATIADAIASIEKAGPNASHLRLRIFKAAEQMVSIGGLPVEEITGDFLLSLPEDDVEPIFNAQDELEKKQKGLRKPSSHI